jgi:hypothetical protein
MRIVAGILLYTLPLAGVVRAEDSAAAAAQIEFFEKKVRPLLAERCYKCHGPSEQEGNLRLDSRDAILRGGDTGPAIDPGKPEESELILAVSYDPAGYQMPPDGKLPDADIQTLTEWVRLGAPWPVSGAGPAMDADASWEEEFARRSEHWSFQPLHRPAPPEVQDDGWVRNPIDRFLLAKLEGAGLQPAPEADRATWIRRASFDVTGLPPTPEEAQAFLTDDSPQAFSRVIDRLLASPHFGERWGRHWMDLVRYAESRGHEFDYDVANPWHYRDYIIQALNDDVAYDQLVTEHVAGDLLSVECPVSSVQCEGGDEGRGSSVEGGDGTALSTLNTGHSTLDTLSTLNSQLATHHLRLDPRTGANLSILGTGFWFFGEWVHSPVDIRQDEADRFENMIDVYSKTFLGLTVACARCHDHKFDPISTKDYYALQGYLQSSSYRQVRFETMEHNRRIAEQLEAVNREATAAIHERVQSIEQPVRSQLTRYLLASHEMLQSGKRSTDNASVAEAAARHDIDPALLAQWVDHIEAAANETDHPLHRWACYATGRIATLADLTRTLQEDTERWLSSAPGPLSWSKNHPDDDFYTGDELILDGPGFVVAPRGNRDGLICLSDDPAEPIEFTLGPGELAWDPGWKIASTPGDASEPGATSSWDRAGRMARTPGFEITEDRIYCLVRGAVNTYVAVDSHLLIHGPLHGSLVKKHPGREKWHWIEHDVSRYKGHRAHLELVPVPGEPFAVAQIFQASRTPEAVPGPLLLSDVPVSAEAIASEFARQVDPLQHRELFGLDAPEARSAIEAAARPFMEHRQKLLSQIKPVSSSAPAMLDGSGEDEYVFIRGNWKKRGDVVPRRFLEVFGRRDKSPETRVKSSDGAGSELLSTLDPQRSTEAVKSSELRVQSDAGDIAESPSTPNAQLSTAAPHSTLDTQHSTLAGSGRLQLAEQMVDPEQTPIVARVIVNRIWQHYFGRGIVPTPDDFGFLGTPPTHPELLDWLAMELVEHDWSLKHVHRLILTSAAYRMSSRVYGLEFMVYGEGGSASRDGSLNHKPSTINSSQPSTTNPLEIDPANSLLHHMPVKRLEGEIIRDAMLHVSGRLDKTLYGPSVPVHLTPFMEGRGRPGESGPVDGRGRRSLYIAVRRNFPDPFFQAFDFPNPHSCIGRRNVSNVPAQALAMMNNPLVREQSRLWARRVLNDEAGAAIEDRIARFYAAAFSRKPTAAEIEQGRQFIEAQSLELARPPDSIEVWADYAHVLLNAKEFLFVR